MSNDMIIAEQLRKSYRRNGQDTHVLQEVSFTIGRGEFVVFMGASGSGKTTLLNILGLLDRPDSGRYLLDGSDFATAGDEQLSETRNRKIGFVFQQFNLLDRVSALRNVTLPLLYSDQDTGDERARAEHALETVGLAHRSEHMPNELSGGEQQRVAIARALINDPVLILADEPTGNLDTENADGILEIFRQLVETGRTIVAVTHDQAAAQRADRVLVLEQGRIASDQRIHPQAVQTGEIVAPST